MRDEILNKLAILALTILLSLSTLLWYLANQSLNEYLKSQIELQGSYYTNQQTKVDIANFSSNTAIGKFKKLNLLNLDGQQAEYAIIIDEADIALQTPPTQPLLTTIKTISINKLTINNEINSEKVSNINQLITTISHKLAHDYPELYPNISAKIYAEKHPQLDAEKYALNNPQAGPIIEHTQPKKQRGKPQNKINISEITINTVEINIFDNGVTRTKLLNDVEIPLIGGKQGIVANQLGGEILLALLSLTTQS
jgi:hypothetical protein